MVEVPKIGVLIIDHFCVEVGSSVSVPNDNRPGPVSYLAGPIVRSPTHFCAYRRCIASYIPSFPAHVAAVNTTAHQQGDASWAFAVDWAG